MADPLTYANSDEYILVNPSDPKVGHLIYDAPMVDAETKQFIRDPETGKIKVYRMVIWGTKGLTQAQVESLISQNNVTLTTKINNLESTVTNFLDADDTTLDQLSELITEIKANKANIGLLVSSKATKEELQQAVNTINTNLANYMDLASTQTVTGNKTFTGTVEVPTVTSSDNSTKAASTAFVKTALNSITGISSDGLVNKDEAQTITGLKTFSTLPQSSVTPLDNKDMTTKIYVDNKVQSAIDDADNKFVTLSTAQYIRNLKTFNDVLPQSNLTPKDDKDFVNKAYVDNHVSVDEERFTEEKYYLPYPEARTFPFIDSSGNVNEVTSEDDDPDQFSYYISKTTDSIHTKNSFSHFLKNPIYSSIYKSEISSDKLLIGISSKTSLKLTEILLQTLNRDGTTNANTSLGALGNYSKTIQVFGLNDSFLYEDPNTDKVLLKTIAGEDCYFTEDNKYYCKIDLSDNTQYFNHYLIIISYNNAIEIYLWNIKFNLFYKKSSRSNLDKNLNNISTEALSKLDFISYLPLYYTFASNKFYKELTVPASGTGSVTSEEYIAPSNGYFYVSSTGVITAASTADQTCYIEIKVGCSYPQRIYPIYFDHASNSLKHRTKSLLIPAKKGMPFKLLYSSKLGGTNKPKLGFIYNITENFG